MRRSQSGLRGLASGLGGLASGLGGLGRTLGKFAQNTTKTVFPSGVNMNKVTRAFRVYIGELPPTNNIALNPKETTEFNKLVAKSKAQQKFTGNWQVVQQSEQNQRRKARSVVGPSNRRNGNGNGNGNRGPPPAAGPAAGPANSNSGSPKLSANVLRGLTSDQKEEIVHLALTLKNLDEGMMASSTTVFQIASEVANIIHNRKQRQQNRGPPAAGPANSNELLSQLVQRTQEKRALEQRAKKAQERRLVKAKAVQAKGRIPELHKKIKKELERIHKNSNENLKQAQLRRLNDLYGKQFRELYRKMSMNEAINTAGFRGKGPLDMRRINKLRRLRSPNTRNKQLTRIKRKNSSSLQNFTLNMEKRRQEAKRLIKQEWEEKLKKAKGKGRGPPRL
jgi:hypothetical protein